MNTPTLISFSGGRSSAMMTKKLQDIGFAKDTHIVFANTGKETPETLDFVNECDKRWNLGVIWIEYIPQKPFFKIVTYETASRKGEPFEALIDKRKYLPNIAHRMCTGELKVKPMKQLMKSLKYKFWNVALGIRYDEPLRWGRILQNTQKEPFFYELPLYEWGVTKADVKKFWSEQDFDLQLKGYQGNCDLCFLKGKAKLIQLIRENPAKADWWIQQEKKVQNTFKKDNSYSDLVDVATNQLEIDFESIDYPCHCNID